MQKEHKSSLKNVYYRSFVCLIVIPLIVVSAAATLVVHYVMRRAALDTVDAQQESIVGALVNDIENASLQLSHFVYVNEGECMQTAVEAFQAEGTRQFNANKKLNQNFQTAMVPSHRIISGKFFMRPEGSVYMKDDIVLPQSTLRQESWYRQALEKPDTVVVGGYDSSRVKLISTGQKTRQLILVTALAPSSLLDRSGSIEMVTFFTMSSVGDLFKGRQASAAPGRSVLLDADGRLLYGDMGDEAVRQYFESTSSEWQPGTFTRKAQLEDSARNYLFKVRTVPQIGWKVVTFVESAGITQEFNRVGAVLAAVVVLLLGLFYLFSRYFLNAIITPIHTVAQGMEQLVGNDLNVQVQPQGQQEIHTLMESFNQMVLSLKHMLDTNEEAMRRKHNAEIQALQSQINPHFIVNTLNSIRFMAQVAKFEGMEKMTSALIKIVSCSFRSNASFYTVREELDVLDSYIYLMRIRYSDGFEAEYDLDPACMNYKVPRLILQPIVENSITHGLADLDEEMGLVRVSVYREEDALCLAVWDNGQGMEPEQIAEVLRGRPREKQDNTSIGLENVLARIRLHFGRAARVQIESKKGEYTKTVLRLPIDRLEQDTGRKNDDPHIDRG